ncbi:hypothetical protein [Rhizobium sp. Root483D2]|uniref:hypothetical protein n=1 Tax=Rhizobium sp. Root483D2 TaxID=1736545 RepID=UPI000AA1A74F|nr:hypothetical protein [Rhizobium sp. Root483D2]
MENTVVLTSTQEQIVKIIAHTDKRLFTTVDSALEVTVKQVKDELQRIGHVDAAPPMEYFTFGVLQRMYCMICGADPETFAGGDPESAYHVIRNCQNIAQHYWSANIEPYPPL